MSEGVAIQQHKEQTEQTCRHHWVIETPHGATSRGVCKHCGAVKRFPNAAEDYLWEREAPGPGRWSRGAGYGSPAEIRLSDSSDEAF